MPGCRPVGTAVLHPTRRKALSELHPFASAREVPAVISPLRVPLLTAVLSVLGLCLAVWGHNWGQWGVGIVAAAAVPAAIVVPKIANQKITTKPRLALRIFESLSIVSGFLSAVMACLTVLGAVALIEI